MFFMQKRKKLIGIFVAILVCAVFFIRLVRPGEPLSATAVGIVDVNGYLNVRTGAGTGFPVLKSGGTNVTLSDGQNVTIIAVSGKWYHIRFKWNSKTLKGYVYSQYVNVQTGSVKTSVSGKTAVTAAVRKKASSSAQILKINGKNVSLSKDTKINIWSETVVGKKKWYRISFVNSGKNYYGYILSTQANAIYNKGIPGILKSSKSVSLTKQAGKTAVVKLNGAGVAIPNGKQLTILSEKTVSGVKYSYVSVRVKKNTIKGYLPANSLLFQIVKNEKASVSPTAKPKATASPKATQQPKASASPKATVNPEDLESASPSASAAPLSQSAFKKQLQKEGFPESYIPDLLKLHEKYPYWQFKAYNTKLSWSTVISKESAVGLNLLSNSKSIDWKSLEDGAYNWKTDKFIPFDGSTWVTASQKAVKYYMDPRNFLDEKSIFQFESLEYQSDTQTQSGVENILKNTPMYKTSYTYENSDGKEVSIHYSKTFMKAASSSKVSPYHLASRVKQEVVTGASSMSNSVSGNVSGYPGIYNFYNIGAYHSTASGGAIANGLKWASSGTTYQRPWNNRYKSIVGGAQYIGKNYINIGQNTLYLEKFNVTPTSTYNHQYMANIAAPSSEAAKTYAAYGGLDEKMSITFSIPVYKDMPSSACEMPSGGLNPNNYLKTLYVKNYAFSSKFVLGDNGSKTYSVTVPNNVTSIKICATKVSSSAKLSGTGNKSLSVGTKTFTVKVTSQSGSVRSYKIKVTRKAAVKTAKKVSKNTTVAPKNTETPVKTPSNEDKMINAEGNDKRNEEKETE